jgi:hypothetical protein
MSLHAYCRREGPRSIAHATGRVLPPPHIHKVTADAFRHSKARRGCSETISCPDTTGVPGGNPCNVCLRCLFSKDLHRIDAECGSDARARPCLANLRDALERHHTKRSYLETVRRRRARRADSVKCDVSIAVKHRCWQPRNGHRNYDRGRKRRVVIDHHFGAAETGRARN